MTNNITEAVEHASAVAQLTLLVRELRSLRDRTARETGRQVSFAEVADILADIKPSPQLQDYLRELARILDANAASAVDADLDERWRSAVAPQREIPPSDIRGLPKLLS